MKKFVAALLCLVMTAALLAGCGGNNDAAQNNNDDTAEGLKIAIVSSPSGVDDGSFNENN